MLRGDGLDSSNDVGVELDLVLSYPIDRNLEAQAGYAHFFAGELIEETGSAEDIDFAYFSLQFTF